VKLPFPPRPSIETMWLAFSRNLRTTGEPLDSCRHVFYVGALCAISALLEEIDNGDSDQWVDYVTDLETELRTWMDYFERPEGRPM
jgi:hypothetical protein